MTGSHEVRGSIPLGSTKFSKSLAPHFQNPSLRKRPKLNLTAPPCPYAEPNRLKSRRCKHKTVHGGFSIGLSGPPLHENGIVQSHF